MLKNLVKKNDVIRIVYFSDLVAELPFTLMHPKPYDDNVKIVNDNLSKDGAHDDSNLHNLIQLEA